MPPRDSEVLHISKLGTFSTAIPSCVPQCKTGIHTPIIPALPHSFPYHCRRTCEAKIASLESCKRSGQPRLPALALRRNPTHYAGAGGSYHLYGSTSLRNPCSSDAPDPSRTRAKTPKLNPIRLGLRIVELGVWRPLGILDMWCSRTRYEVVAHTTSYGGQERYKRHPLSRYFHHFLGSFLSIKNLYIKVYEKTKPNRNRWQRRPSLDAAVEGQQGGRDACAAERGRHGARSE